MLATIISTSGSTPASAFSKMLVKENGIISMGTIGGGCMEGDVLLHSRRLLETGKTEILSFHLNEDDIEHGLICGGSLEVMIEPVTRGQISLFKEILSSQNEGNDTVLATLVSSEGKVVLKKILRKETWSNGELSEGLLSEEQWSKEFDYSNPPTLQPSVLKAEIEKTFSRNETRKIKTQNGTLILEPIQGTPSLIIFGGGHVSKYISKIAAMCGFQITVIDDREKFANNQRFPEAKETFARDFKDIFQTIIVTQSTYIVIVTRGHQFDEVVLEQVIKTNAKYIGMIGSKRKVLATYEHLRARGISNEQLKHIHSPMGIEIGATTAEEIAVSIVAEMIRVRRGGKEVLSHKSDSLKEYLQ